MKMLRTPSPALVVSLVALFVALGGTSLAAASYINGKRIKPHSIPKNRLTGGAIKSLRGAKGARGAAGAPGPKGDTGAAGTPGTAGENAVSLFVSTLESGTIVNSSGSVNVDAQGNGSYIVTFPQDVSECVPSVSIGNTSANVLPAGFAAARADGPINANDLDLVDVVTHNTAGTATNLPFNLAMSCPVP